MQYFRRDTGLLLSYPFSTFSRTVVLSHAVMLRYAVSLTAAIHASQAACRIRWASQDTLHMGF